MALRTVQHETTRSHLTSLDAGESEVTLPCLEASVELADADDDVQVSNAILTPMN